MKKVKVGKSKIHGNGLFADEPIKRGDVIELVHTIRELEPGVIKTTPTLLGRNYNHSDDSNALNVVDGNNRYLVALKEIEAGGEITTDYRTNPELEQPGSFTTNDNYVSFDYDDTLTTPEGFKLAQQMNKEGKNLYVITARDKVTPQMIERAEAAGIPKENIIPAGSDEAKVRIIKENNITKHIDNKDSVIKALGDKGELFAPDKYPDFKADFVEMELSDDDLNKLQEGGFIVEESPDKGIITQEEIDAANNAMMKARLAYAQMHGNPAAQRMVVAPDQPYVYTGEEYDKDWNMPVGVPAGETGTHYMASFGNYAVPFIQQGPNGLQFNESPSIRDREAIRFDSEADAEYFGGHYKEVAPDKSYRRKIENGSPYITSLSPEDEEEFQRFYNTLPENLQSDDPSYDIRGYWDSEGRPEEFDYSQPKEDDGYYHAYSINQNTGEYLKNPWHPTFQHAIDEDKKIGYRPVVNVKGELIATENPSIADPEEQTFLRNIEGPANYIEAELTPEEIEEYRKGGFIVEELDTYPKGGDPGKGKKGKSKKVEPFVTSDPEEYAYRKAAYDDSSHVAKYFNSQQPAPEKFRTYRSLGVKTKLPYYKQHKDYIDDPDIFDASFNAAGVSPAWRKYSETHKNNKGLVNNPIGLQRTMNIFYDAAAYNPFGKSFGYNLPFGDRSAVIDSKLRFQLPRQKVIFQAKPAVAKKPKVTQQKPIDKPEVIEPTPVPQPVPTPVIVNPELQKFVEERRPELPKPPSGPGTDVMPIYDTDELPMYATPDGGAEWIGDTQRYVDWDGNRIPYRLPRFRKPGHGGDLIRRGKQRYIPFPSIESRYQAEIVPEEEFKKGGEPKKKKRKTDDYGRYRSEDGNVRTPLTPEMQAVMPPEEWGQYIQEFPEVYTTRTKEQQEAMNAARNMQLLNELNYQRAPHLYLPDGSLRPQAAQSADWVWQLGTLGAASGLGRSAVGAAESLGSRALPYVEGALNTSIPGMASIPGATIGNAAGAYFAGDAIVNRLYPSAGKIQEGKYGEAATDIATGLLDLAGANMLSPMYKGAKATASELGKFINTGVPKKLPGSPNGTFAYKNVTPSRIRSTNTGLTNADIDKEVAKNIEWITSSEYARRRAANTGESLEEIQKSVDKIIKDADRAKFNLNSNPRIMDLYERSGVMKTKKWYRPAKVEVSASAEQPVKTLNHEIKHLYSPAIHEEIRIYDNYPTIGSTADDYLTAGTEQQVRNLNAREQILAENNLPIDAQLSEEQVREFVDRWGSKMNKMDNTKDFSLQEDFDHIWSEEAGKIQKEMLKARYNTDDVNFIGTMPIIQKVRFMSEYRDRLAKSITDALNKVWITVPIAGGAGLNSLEPSEQRYGGSISKLNKFIR